MKKADNLDKPKKHWCSDKKSQRVTVFIIHSAKKKKETKNALKLKRNIYVLHFVMIRLLRKQ